jgi:hypothetical protein
MLKNKLFKTVLAVTTMVLLAPSQFALAATPQSLDEFFGYKWDGTNEKGDANSYPQPPDIDGAPGFVPFNNVFSPVTALGTGDTTTVPGSSVLTNSDGADVGVEVTNKKTAAQQGSIWNTTGNELDLTKNFHAQMQLYFGAKDDSADGLAFVMAGSRPSTLLSGGGGGRLGIWGDMSKSRKFATTTAYKTALPNSFAIAFDTYSNVGTWTGNDSQVYGDAYIDAGAFDLIQPATTNLAYPSRRSFLTGAKNADGAYNQYVGYGYPSQPNQYAWLNISTVGDTSYAAAMNTIAFSGNGQQYARSGKSSDWNGTNVNGMGEAQLVPRGKMTDGAWHLLTLDYKADGAGGGTLTYTTDLSATDGSAVSKSITWSAADIQNYFHTNKVAWGFTGATGARHEDGVVAFQSIPGILDNSIDTKLMADDGSTDVTKTYLGRQYQQQYTINYNGANSKQSWPSGTSSHLAADLKTGDHYGFVVNDNGKVTVKLVDPDGTETTAEADPVSTEPDVINGETVTVARNIRLSDIGSMLKDKGAQTIKITVPVKATSTSDTSDTANSGTVGGDNGIVTGKVELPGPQIPPLSFDAAPDFDFGTVGVLDMIAGLKNKPGTVANGSKFHITLPGDTLKTVQASMTSFGVNGAGGNVTIGFKLGDSTTPVTIKDNGAASNIFTGKTISNQDITDPTITTAPSQTAKQGSYSSQITWSIVDAPAS